MLSLTHEREEYSDHEELVFLDGHGLNARVPYHTCKSKVKMVVQEIG